MKIINQPRMRILGMLLILAVVVSCARVPVINVTYRLPSKSDALKGEKVFLSFEDKRTFKDIIGEGARKEYKGFSGNISFSLARGEEPGFKRGAYDVPSIFKEVFKRRLEHLGIEVVPDRKGAQVELLIALKDFLLDLRDSKWVVNMGYEASLIKDKKGLAKQRISGQAERLKLVGRGQADKVMGDLFTDLVNKLDVKRLFYQADL